MMAGFENASGLFEKRSVWNSWLCSNVPGPHKSARIDPAGHVRHSFQQPEADIAPSRSKTLKVPTDVTVSNCDIH
jgi:hypothetical protein